MTSDAGKCRRNGWKPGTLIVGDEGYGPTVIKITAIGEDNILAKPVSHNGVKVEWYEGPWTLAYRNWKQVRSRNVRGNK